MDRCYSIGIDPGYIDLGLGILNLTTRVGIFHNINFLTWDNVRHKIKERDYGKLLLKLIEDYAYYFERAESCYIEEQSIGKRTVLKIQCYLEQSIRIKYPHCYVKVCHPRSVKCYLNMPAGGSHEESKKIRGRELENIINAPNMRLMKSLFRRNYKEHLDSLEAMQTCFYGLQEKKDNELIFGNFKRTEFTCTVLRPEECPFIKVKKIAKSRTKLEPPKKRVKVSLSDCKAKNKKKVESFIKG